jgi:uncharacterized protein YndB with AHSA1/START domain
MSDYRITRRYSHSPTDVWRAVTDPELVPLWTSTGRGGRPEGFSPKPVPGWRGVVECEVLEARPPSLLRYSWLGDENGETTKVAYRIESDEGGTRFTFEHTGFTGLGGFVMAKLVLGPVRKKMLDVGLPAVLDGLETDGHGSLRH